MFKLVDVYFCVKAFLLCGFVDCSVQFLNGRSGDESFTRIIEDYFPRENSLLVVQTGSSARSILPKFPLPVVLFTADTVLQNCSYKVTEHDGYVFISSGNKSLESQTAPLLQCFSQTTSTLKTKHILVVHLPSENFSKECISSMYISFFKNTWKTFGIANVAVLYVQNQVNNRHEYFEIFLYNPFLAETNSSFNALIRNSQPQDARSIMYNRFRNMHNYTLKGVFQTNLFLGITHQDFIGKKTLGAVPTILFKNILESSLKVNIEAYEAPKPPQHVLADRQRARETIGASSVAELINGNADILIGYQMLTGLKEPEKVDKIHTGVVTQYVFVVPYPKEVESWRLFQYIFEWRVSVSLGLALMTLSVIAAFFVHCQPSSPSQSASSEVVSVWKAVFSASINKLPRSNSQRFLIAMALLLGLIIVTISCAQLFALMKSKPRQPSIRTLHDLQESNLPIYCPVQCIPVLDSLKNTSLEKLRSQLITNNTNVLGNGGVYNASNLNVTDRAILYSAGTLRIVEASSEGRVVSKCFEVVKEPLITDMLFTTLPKGSLYADIINKVNLRLSACGIFFKWFVASNSKRIDALYKKNQSAMATKPTHADDTSVPLKYKDLEIAFFVLYIGLTASVLCFVLELIVAKVKFV